MTVQEAFNNYILFKRASSLSEATIKDYKYHLLPFLRFFGSEREISSISYNDVLTFFASVSERWKSQGTRYTYLHNAKLFLEWLYNSSGPDTLVFIPDSLPKLKKPKKKVYRLSDGDIRYLFQIASSSKPWIAVRNQAILALLLGSGLRLHEVVCLRSYNIDFQSQSLVVLGKGDKPRAVGFGQLANYYMKEYEKLCPHSMNDFFFRNNDGCPLSDNAVKMFVYRLKKITGIPFSAHSLRHNYATAFVDYQMDHFHRTGEQELALVMGHASVSTTLGYVHVAEQQRSVKSYVDILQGICEPWKEGA